MAPNNDGQFFGIFFARGGGARVDGKIILKHLFWSLLLRKTIAQCNTYLVPFMQALDFKK